MFKKLLTLAAFAAAVVGANAEESWVNILTNGDAEGEYGDVPCAFGKVLGTEPTACTIEEEADGNHVFVVHATAKESAAWDNQFWIMAPQTFEEGETFKVSFKCKATKDAKVGTQAHTVPGTYLHWNCIGDINFKAGEWTEVSKSYTVDSSANGMQSIAFNLNDFADANDYYFDDIKWEINENAAEIEKGEYTVWAGEKQCDWGDPVVISASVFKNVKVGDKLQVWSSGAGCQILLGGWSGLNLPIYSVGAIDNMTYEDGVATIEFIDIYKENNEYVRQVEVENEDGEKEWVDEVYELDVFSLLKANGVVIQGPTTITRVDYIPADTEVEEPEVPEIETSEYTVWVGPKQCNWGDAVAVPAEVFANPLVGDKLQVWSSEWGCQIILGGWPGLNLPIYGVSGIDNMTYEDGVATIEFIDKYSTNNTYTWFEEQTNEDGDKVQVEVNKDYDVFALLKENGVVIQGPTIISRVDYIPATSSIAAIEATDAAPVYYNLQGVRVDNPNNGIYIVKRGNKVTKQAIR